MDTSALSQAVGEPCFFGPRYMFSVQMCERYACMHAHRWATVFNWRSSLDCSQGKRQETRAKALTGKLTPALFSLVKAASNCLHSHAHVEPCGAMSVLSGAQPTSAAFHQ